MKTAIIIDCFNIGWSAGFAMKGLEYEGQPTNVLYGFFKTILQAAKYIHTPATLVFAWDSKKSKRKILYPDYKKKRNERVMSNDDLALIASIQNQLCILRDDIVPSLGFNNSFMKTGYEADDIVAVITKSNYFDECLVLSTDNDLLQLITPSVSIYSPKTSKLITYDTFTNTYGIQPEQWALVKAMAGCHSDEVPGIKGVAEKTAIAYLTGDLSANKVKKIEIALLTEEYARDKKLVTLPYDDSLHFEIKYDTIKRRKLFDLFSKYEFVSLMRKEAVRQWMLLLDLV